MSKKTQARAQRYKGHTESKGSWYTATECPTNKRAFTTRAAAKAASKTALPTLGRMRPYVCGECGSWHIGHVSQHAWATN